MQREREREREREMGREITRKKKKKGWQIRDRLGSSIYALVLSHSIFSHTYKHDERSKFNGKQTKIFLLVVFFFSNACLTCASFKAHIFLTLIMYKHTHIHMHFFLSPFLSSSVRPLLGMSGYVFVYFVEFWTLSRQKFSVCEKLSSWENTILVFVQLHYSCQKYTHVLHFQICNWFTTNPQHIWVDNLRYFV